MRSMLRVGLLAMLATCAFGALAAASAQAVEGPSWRVEKVKLAGGATKEWTSSGGEFKLIIYKKKEEEVEAERLGAVVCKKVKNTGEKMTGIVIGTDPGTDEAEIIFELCEVQGPKLVAKEFPNCEVNSKFLTEDKVGIFKFKTELVFPGNTKQREEAGDVLTGSETFEEGTTKFEEVLQVLEIKGTCPAELTGKLPVLGNPVARLDEEEKESPLHPKIDQTKLQWHFPHPRIKLFEKWSEKEKKYIQEEAGLKVTKSHPAQFQGQIFIALEKGLKIGWEAA